jgi:Xaa-Pro aminopeptidase
MRAVKEEVEIAKIKEALKISGDSFSKIKPLLREGVSEVEIAATLEFEIRIGGGDGVGFPSIVASGSRTSLPHAKATHKRLKKGEPLIIDWGAIYDGYHSDLTRTLFIGKVDKEIMRIYKVVLEALEYGLSIIRPGILASELDQKVREFIKDRGFGAYFGHNLGHGVGLDVHEAPEISSKNRCRLKEGMVFTVEPGVYIPGKGGVRIEEMVVVRKDGCEVLSEGIKRDELYIPP